MNRIEKLQNEMSTWYETSSIGHFMQWWFTELKTFVPKKYHEALFPQAIKIYITQNSEQVTVWNKIANKITPYSNDDSSDLEQEKWWHQVQHIINNADGKKVQVQFLLANDEALVRRIALPQAAKENLAEVIEFELDKYVPFNSDQVEISYKIDKKNSDENKLLLDLAVVPKQKLTDVLSLCEKNSVELDGIDINMRSPEIEPDYLGVNLLPSKYRKAKNYNNLKLNSVLSVLLIALIYFVIDTSISSKQDKIENLTEINSQLQKQAKTSKSLRKELKSVIVSSKFLQNKKNDISSVVTVLSELTSILPDTTYLSKVKVSEGKLEITGQSDNANVLVPELNKSSNWFAPQISGPITPDPRTKKERFTIKAELKEPQPEDENDSNS